MLRKLNVVNISLIIIAIIMLATVLTFRRSSSNTNTRHSTHMDYFAYQAKQTRYNRLGQRISHSQSPYLYHMPQHDIAYIEKPVNTSWSQQQDQWTLHANKAINHHATNTTYLLGHVVIVKAKTNTQPAMIIHTDHATYNGNTHIATTNAFVTIDQGKNHQEGTGAIIKFKQKTWQLLSQARGHYVNK